MAAERATTIWDELGMSPVEDEDGELKMGYSCPTFGPSGRAGGAAQVSDIPAPDPSEAFRYACEGRVPYGAQVPLRFNITVLATVLAQEFPIGPLEAVVPWALIDDDTVSTAGRLFIIKGPAGKTITAEGTNIAQNLNISNFTEGVLRSGYNPLNRTGRIDNTKPMKIVADGAAVDESIAGIFYCYRI
jgi:hypothetical protein